MGKKSNKNAQEVKHECVKCHPNCPYFPNSDTCEWVYDEENRMYRYFFSLVADNLGNDPLLTEGKKWLSAGTTAISGVVGEVITYS